MFSKHIYSTVGFDFRKFVKLITAGIQTNTIPKIRLITYSANCSVPAHTHTHIIGTKKTSAERRQLDTFKVGQINPPPAG